MAKVLIVDDRPANREYLVTLLCYRGYELIQASDGAEALESIRRERPDLVIADVLMPTMDGYELVKQLRLDPEVAHVPVIFYTAHYLEGEARKLAESCGVAVVLKKPADPGEVLATVESVLGVTPLPPTAPAREFDRDHLEVLTNKLAKQADTLRIVNARQAALLDFYISLASEQDPGKILKEFCRAAREIIGAKYAAVGAVGQGGNSLRYFFTSGISKEDAALITPTPAEGILGDVLTTSRANSLCRFTGEPIDLGLGAPFSTARSVVVAPIASLRKVYGWICLAEKLGYERFDTDDESLASAFAAQVGRIYENGTLYAEAQERAAELLREVSTRTRAEEQLRKSEARLQYVLASSPSALFTLKYGDNKPTPTWVSPNISRLIGFSEEELTTQGWWPAHVHPDDRERLLAEIEALKNNNEATFEYRLRHGDGSYRWIQNRLRVLCDATGAPAEIIGLWIDITDHKQLQEQFFQAQKMEAIGRLAGGVAHDFNNLLTAITGYSQLALAQLDESSPLYSSVKETHRAGESAAVLTRQLLIFSRKQTVEPKLIEMNALVTEMQGLLKRLIGEDVELTMTLNAERSLVRADPGQLEQVIMNLAVNARDAMPTGGRIQIETDNVFLDDTQGRRAGVGPGSYVVVGITDTGSGMDSETLSHIFEPFFTTKGEGKGTGLGLSTVYAIVQQSRGHVWVSSEVGHGTTFRIYLPRATGVSEPLSELATTGHLPRGTETVLLVEDEPFVRQLAAIVLREQGYNVFEAENGEHALATLSQPASPSVDLLVTDVVMPKMGGKDLAALLLKKEPSAKVLFVSAYTDDAIVHHGVLDGNYHFLQKPFTPSSLALKVREVLDGPR